MVEHLLVAGDGTFELAGMRFQGLTEAYDTVQPATVRQYADILQWHTELLEPDNSAQGNDLFGLVITIAVVAPGQGRGEQANAVIVAKRLGSKPVTTCHLSDGKHGNSCFYW
ncbi:hypothetical protein D3C81_1673720 [compost metagenome]